MSDIAIKVENLSKCYRIGLKEQRSETLGGAIGSWLKAPFSNLKQLHRMTRFDTDETTASLAGVQNNLIWALSNISFTVREGEVIGIIGRNGAGKSTLLKILSRIVEPTAGSAVINGRIASLLEVGTGFHPELTGRENVYLNGVILGMTKAEIDRKFDEIADFAEIDKFLDTPVKRYSSGMKVRLAFAVAAHLEPEILLIDEVLAVGDAIFQKKCIGKMGDVSKDGRTVLFVSHNMATVQNLCSRTIVLSDGKLLTDSDTEKSIEHYLRIHSNKSGSNKVLSDYRAPYYQPVIKDVRLIDRYGNDTVTLRAGDEMTVQIFYEFKEPLQNPSFGIGVDSFEGYRLFLFQTKLQYGATEKIAQSGVANCRVPSMPLAPGGYYLTFGVTAANDQQIDRLESALAIQVVESDYYGTGKLPDKKQGKILVKADWSFE